MARVLVIGDTHAPGMREDYPDFLWDTYKSWKCDRVVHVGDLVDFHAISFHGKHPHTDSIDEEVAQARTQVQRIYKMFPKAEWLIGNHDCLSQRQAVKAGMPSDILREPAEYWKVPKWTVHPRFSRIEIDGVLYSHGETGPGGKFPAFNQAINNFQSTIIGHFHAAAGVWYVANTNHLVFGMNVGCGINWELLQFEYGQKFAKKPILGCGVVIDGLYPYFEPMRL